MAKPNFPDAQRTRLLLDASFSQGLAELRPRLAGYIATLRDQKAGRDDLMKLQFSLLAEILETEELLTAIKSIGGAANRTDAMVALFGTEPISAQGARVVREALRIARTALKSVADGLAWRVLAAGTDSFRTAAHLLFHGLDESRFLKSKQEDAGFEAVMAYANEQYEEGGFPIICDATHVIQTGDVLTLNADGGFVLQEVKSRRLGNSARGARQRKRMEEVCHLLKTGRGFRADGLPLVLIEIPGTLNSHWTELNEALIAAKEQHLASRSLNELVWAGIIDFQAEQSETARVELFREGVESQFRLEHRGWPRGHKIAGWTNLFFPTMNKAYSRNLAPLPLWPIPPSEAASLLTCSKYLAWELDMTALIDLFNIDDWVAGLPEKGTSSQFGDAAIVMRKGNIINGVPGPHVGRILVETLEADVIVQASRYVADKLQMHDRISYLPFFLNERILWQLQSSLP